MPKKKPEDRLREQPAGLSDEMLIAIGAVVAEWSMLEHIALLLFMANLKIDANRARLIAAHLRNPDRLLQVLSVGPSPMLAERAAELEELRQEISRLSGERNEIAHGWWMFTDEDADGAMHSASMTSAKLKMHPPKSPRDVRRLATDIRNATDALWRTLLKAPSPEELGLDPELDPTDIQS